MTDTTTEQPPIVYDGDAVSNRPSRLVRQCCRYFDYSLEDLVADELATLVASAALSEEKVTGRLDLAKYDDMSMVDLTALFARHDVDQAVEDAQKS